jgi:hypothetical protein
MISAILLTLGAGWFVYFLLTHKDEEDTDLLPNPIQGEIWQKKEGNPFADWYEVEVLYIINGWIQFKPHFDIWYNKDSMPLRQFKKIYQKHGNN